MSSHLTGTIAALLTSRSAGGRIDGGTLAREVDFVISSGVDGICIGGATGEYAGWEVPERRQALEISRDELGARGWLIAGIGAARLSDCVVLGTHAFQTGADAVLLPAPYFFPYSEEDLEAFYREAARQIKGPVLIYNLPQFTSGLGPRSVFRLVDSVDNIIGVKDSSGGLEILEFVTRELSPEVVRFVGHDGVIAEALSRGYCDGTVSGIAGVLPELTVAQFAAKQSGDEVLFDYCRQRVEEVIDQLDLIPAPWGLKLIADLRGLAVPDFPLPLSFERERQAEIFRSWFRCWWPDCARTIAQSAPSARSLGPHREEPSRSGAGLATDKKGCSTNLRTAGSNPKAGI